MRTILGIILLAVLVGGLYALNDATRTEDGKSILNVAGEVSLAVDVAQPKREGIIRTVQAPGDVEAVSEVDISAEVMGKILELPVEEGDHVEQGELLAKLDNADYTAMLLSAQANVDRLKALIAQAEAEAVKAERDYDRQVKLSEANATSKLELADYHTTMLRARAALESRRHELVSAEAAAANAQEDLEKTVIRSPLAGVVSQRFADLGEVVITGTMNNPGTRIMVISDLSEMQVRCRIDETDAPLVQEDQPARIYLQSDMHNAIPGRVLRVATKGTRQLGRDVVTFETLVLVESNDKRVKPGMTANVEIEVDRQDDALTIPVEAVVYRKRRDLPEDLLTRFDEQRAESDEETKRSVAEYLKLVFCIQDKKATPHLVTTGIADAERVQILAGLEPEATVVVGPYRSLDQLKSGSLVKVNDDKKESADTEDADAEGTATEEAVAEEDGQPQNREADPGGSSEAEPQLANDDTASGSATATEENRASTVQADEPSENREQHAGLEP
jgi:HlyD family secretion protein